MPWLGMCGAAPVILVRFPLTLTEPMPASADLDCSEATFGLWRVFCNSVLSCHILLLIPRQDSRSELQGAIQSACPCRRCWTCRQANMQLRQPHRRRAVQRGQRSQIALVAIQCCKKPCRGACLLEAAQEIAKGSVPSAAFGISTNTLPTCSGHFTA